LKPNAALQPDNAVAGEARLPSQSTISGFSENAKKATPAIGEAFFV
jgi:hypothetical protein